MEKLDLYGTIDACVCLSGQRQPRHASPTALQRALRRVWLFLEAGGLFIFDVHTPEQLAEPGRAGLFLDETDDAYCVWRHGVLTRQSESAPMRMDLFRREGERPVVPLATELHEERAYYRIETLTEAPASGRASLTSSDLWRPPDATPPRPGRQRVFFTARKPEEAIEHMR